VTFQRKLLLGFSLMVLPALLVGAEAIRSNSLERRALDALGESMARTRTYAELETAMFNQSEIIWRYLSGMDPSAAREFELSHDVVSYWQARWVAELRPEEKDLGEGVAVLQRELRRAGDSVIALYDAGLRQEAYRTAQLELKGRLHPALTAMNRNVYRRARESSVRGAYTRLEEILAGESRTLVLLIGFAVALGLLASWIISRGLSRPIHELAGAMAVVGSGRLDHPIAVTSRDEVGELAAAFARMTANLRHNVAQLERTQAQYSPRSSRRSARWPPRWPMVSATRSPVSGPRRSSSAATRNRRPRASTSTRSSRRWIGSTGGSATSSASVAPRRSGPCPNTCRGWSKDFCRPSPSRFESVASSSISISRAPCPR
jgi:HAMP domain-containing protein